MEKHKIAKRTTTHTIFKQGIQHPLLVHPPNVQHKNVQKRKTNRILKQAHLNYQVISFPTKVKDSKQTDRIWEIFLIKHMQFCNP